MAKIDITINRSITYATGNYNTIKPTVGITVKDVDEKDAVEVYNRTTDLIDALMVKETIALANEVNTADRVGVKKYFEVLENSELKIDEVLNKWTEAVKGGK